MELRSEGFNEGLGDDGALMVSHDSPSTSNGFEDFEGGLFRVLN
jgi:hypothetical protein